MKPCMSSASTLIAMLLYYTCEAIQEQWTGTRVGTRIQPTTGSSDPTELPLASGGVLMGRTESMVVSVYVVSTRSNWEFTHSLP